MLIKMRNIWQILKNSLASTTSGASTLSAAEQTRASWAKSIRSYDNLPNIYKEYFEPILAEEREFPYMILTPAFEGFIHGSTEKLICNFGDQIHILERSGNTFEAQCYPIENINYVKVTTVLLDTRITISGLTKQGISATSNVKFNSVTDYLFTPILKNIRFTAMNSSGAVQSLEPEKFDSLAELNYKFMNYARHSLLGQEKVLCSIWQPEIRTGRFRILSKIYYRIISLAHLSILTDRELIMIKEEKQPGGGRYGGTWEYIPLKKITKLYVATRDENLLAVSVQLPDNTHLEYLFQVSVGPEINQFIDRFRELTMR